MGPDGVRAVLPHRFPMLLVDRVLERVPGERITALKAVSVNEPWYQDLSDGAPEEAYDYPGVLIVESWCQAAGILIASENPNPDVLDGQVMLFGGISDVQFCGRVRPGDVMEHRVDLVRALTDTVIFEGSCHVDGRLVARIGRVVMALRPASELTGQKDDAASEAEEEA
ncbi:3-hydroxyacyl-ACP dehydratase [Streptomyces abyssalis]|uniref:3-hydroxyacyl-ACP dehydratase n=2 Tax=Streptomyces abyssalis TaxID=933944 RepID=A0A1E7JQP0_9ACTN|nr:3-hydroxyacyl-ACP dehydratase [Streptomyces abyssalis]OEU90602.1 3-hydroxyacyl-ACP dehydratase [Streptomyces abyssalis]OEV21096.1 3-hydroxyacyl-ACP dehydratase [Streptomyces nanshensis]